MVPCMWHLKCGTNEFICETDSDWSADLCSQGVGVGKDWELAVSRCKLGHTGWTGSQVLPHSTGKCIRHPVMNPSGKARTHIIELLFCSAETNTL